MYLLLVTVIRTEGARKIDQIMLSSVKVIDILPGIK